MRLLLFYFVDVTLWSEGSLDVDEAFVLTFSPSCSIAFYELRKKDVPIPSVDSPVLASQHLYFSLFLVCLNLQFISSYFHVGLEK